MSVLGSLSGRTSRLTSTGIVVAILVVVIVVGAILTALEGRNFFSVGNIRSILTLTSVLGFIAIGQTLVILTAGIDLSCGMVMALGGIVMTKFAVELGLPVPLAVLCGVGVTTLFGLANGLLVDILAGGRGIVGSVEAGERGCSLAIFCGLDGGALVFDVACGAFDNVGGLLVGHYEW